MTNHSVDAKSNTPVAGTTTVDEALDHAKRAFALKKYEEAVDHYATALELMYVETLTLHRVFFMLNPRRVAERSRKASTRCRLRICTFRTERRC